jgi:molybdenum cofactor synthesis domain-containing protein
MKMVPVQSAIGMVLCHDVTRIVRGQSKGAAFKRGHILREEDLPQLLCMGKEHIYVWDIGSDSGLLHENEAAARIAGAAAGKHITLSGCSEGRINLIASIDGLLKIDVEALLEINTGEIVFVSLHTHQKVNKGKVVAGTRVTPLVIEESKVELVESICGRHKPLIEVLPFKALKAGIVTTGSEVYHGRITDQFGPVVREKLDEFECEVIGQSFVSDDRGRIVEEIRSFLSQGAEMIIVTGGMSVDPDDVTPAAIRDCGARVVTYGAPVLPGSMFMLAYLGDVPVLGLPGCVMYHKTSVFDLVLPRLLAGEEITRGDIVGMAHGGLCVNCRECRYPDCGFGKGT